MTKALKSTSCSGRPVDQSNSLRIGSSRQDVQTPLPAAHRKRTCCSLRSDTEKTCCKVREEPMMTSTSGIMTCSYLLHFLPPPFCCQCQPHGLCSSIPPTSGHLLQDSSEWVAKGLYPEASQSVTANSTHLWITAIIS